MMEVTPSGFNYAGSLLAACLLASLTHWTAAATIAGKKMEAGRKANNRQWIGWLVGWLVGDDGSRDRADADDGWQNRSRRLAGWRTLKRRQAVTESCSGWAAGQRSRLRVGLGM